MNPQQARSIIALVDPALSRSPTLDDTTAVAVAQAIADSRTGGFTAGAFWTVVLLGLGYVGYRALTQPEQAPQSAPSGLLEQGA